MVTASMDEIFTKSLRSEKASFAASMAADDFRFVRFDCVRFLDALTAAFIIAALDVFLTRRWTTLRWRVMTRLNFVEKFSQTEQV